MWSFVAQSIPYALTFASPILIASIGALLSEKTGVVNIGLDGLMIIGSFAAAYTSASLFEALGGGSAWMGLLAGAAVGGAFALLHALAVIKLKANQIVSGIAVNMLAVSLSTFVARGVTGSGTVFVRGGITRAAVPFLADLPVLGPFFTKAYPTTYLVILVALATWVFVNKTCWGLRLEACGEHPQAAESVGVHVLRYRYLGVFASGVLCGLGGAIVVLTYQGEFSGSVSGLGYLALTTLVFGKWDVLKVLGASLFFGFTKALATMSALNETLQTLGLPMQVYNALPYAATLLALALFSKNAVAPLAAGQPYEPGRR